MSPLPASSVWVAGSCVNRVGVGGQAGVVALYCLTDSGTARGDGWSQAGDNACEHAATQLSPRWLGQGGKPLTNSHRSHDSCL